MSHPASQPPNEPELRALIRRLLRGTCLVAALFSAFFSTHGVFMAGQILADEVPAGKIVSILGHTKTGRRLALDNGREVVFSDLPLYRRPTPVELAVGDHVEKRRDSCVYFVNGEALTDVEWLLREFLLPVQVVLPLGVYLLVGTLFVLSYRRTPIGDCIWSDADPQLPRRPRTRAGLIAVLLANWVLIFGLITVIFGCLWGCLYGMREALLR